jgi:4-hydroxy-3-polyprenylbenzoate decarboxylase
MTAVTEMGGVIFPPVPAFYSGADSVEALVEHTVQRVLDLFGLHSERLARWGGLKAATVRTTQDSPED